MYQTEEKAEAKSMTILSKDVDAWKRCLSSSLSFCQEKEEEGMVFSEMKSEIAPNTLVWAAIFVRDFNTGNFLWFQCSWAGADLEGGDAGIISPTELKKLRRCDFFYLCDLIIY
jgi:hypothetical protein